METPELDYLELAKIFFLDLKKDLQKEFDDSMGGIGSKDFDINGSKFKIIVDGFWEKVKFFDYKVIDEQGNEIQKGEYTF